MGLIKRAVGFLLFACVIAFRLAYFSAREFWIKSTRIIKPEGEVSRVKKVAGKAARGHGRRRRHLTTGPLSEQKPLPPLFSFRHVLLPELRLGNLKSASAI